MTKQYEVGKWYPLYMIPDHYLKHHVKCLVCCQEWLPGEIFIAYFCEEDDTTLFYVEDFNTGYHHQYNAFLLVDGPYNIWWSPLPELLEEQ